MMNGVAINFYCRITVESLSIIQDPLNMHFPCYVTNFFHHGQRDGLWFQPNMNLRNTPEKDKESLGQPSAMNFVDVIWNQNLRTLF